MNIVPCQRDRRYGVTEDGRVFRIERARFGRPVPYEVKPYRSKDGYLRVGRGGERGLRCETVHRLVAEAFIPNPLGLPQVAHLNGKRDDCARGNLRWDTEIGNAADRIAHGTDWRGSKHRQAKLVEDQVVAICNSRRPAIAIAAEYGVSPQTVNRIRRGEGWTHVPR